MVEWISWQLTRNEVCLFKAGQGLLFQHFSFILSTWMLDLKFFFFFRKKLKNKQHFLHVFPPCSSIYLWTLKLTPLTHGFPSLKFNTVEPLWWRLARNEKRILIFCSIISFFIRTSFCLILSCIYLDWHINPSTYVKRGFKWLHSSVWRLCESLAHESG